MFFLKTELNNHSFLSYFNSRYEKYASLFEEAKIGMLELPYLSEDRLEKLGIPLGPRIRILQEAKIPYNIEGQNYNVYIL